MDSNHPLVKNIENVRDYTSNGDDRSKAKQLIERIKQPSNLVTDTAFWLKVSDNYIGIRERTLWNSQKIIFESSLNRWFQTTGIFIINNVLSPL